MGQKHPLYIWGQFSPEDSATGYRCNRAGDDGILPGGRRHLQRLFHGEGENLKDFRNRFARFFAMYIQEHVSRRNRGDALPAQNRQSAQIPSLEADAFATILMMTRKNQTIWRI